MDWFLYYRDLLHERVKVQPKYSTRTEQSIINFFLNTFASFSTITFEEVSSVFIDHSKTNTRTNICKNNR